MKRLEDIPKKEIFTVPEGYFENLTSKIQARLHQEHLNRKANVSVRSVIWYAVPLMLLIAIGIYFFQSAQKTESVEDIIATIATKDLIAYLNENDISTEEILNEIDFSEADVAEIENEIFEFELDNITVEDFDDLKQDTL
jgi:hypothetical protein